MSANGNGHDSPPPHGGDPSRSEAPRGPAMQSYAETFEAKHGKHHEPTDYFISDYRGIDIVADGTKKSLSYEAANAFAAAISLSQNAIADHQNDGYSLRAILSSAVEFANDRVYQLKQAAHHASSHTAPETHERVAMTAAVRIGERRFAIVHAGDGAAIIVKRDGRIGQLTKQHIFDEEMLEKARQQLPPDHFDDLKQNVLGTPRKRREFKAGRILHTSLDGSQDLKPDITFIDLEDGDILALSTNDVIGNTPEERVNLGKFGKKIIKNRNNGDLSVVAKAVATLRKTSGKEDRTVIIKRVGNPEHFNYRSIRQLLGRHAITHWPPTAPLQYSKAPHEEHHDNDHHDDADNAQNGHQTPTYPRRIKLPRQHRPPISSEWDRNHIGHRVTQEELTAEPDPPTEQYPRHGFPPYNPTASTERFSPPLPDNGSTGPESSSSYEDPSGMPTTELPAPDIPSPTPPNPESDHSDDIEARPITPRRPRESSRGNTLRYIGAATATAGVVIAGIAAEIIRRRKKR